MRTDPGPFDPVDVEICLRPDVTEAAPGPMPTSAPIVQTSLFTFPDFASLIAGLDREHATHVYSRGQNPTVEAFERKLADLERGEACKALSSGMAAIAAVLFGSVSQGDHVLFVNEVYGPTLQLAAELERFGVTHSVCPTPSREAVCAALRRETRLVWLESPGSMRFRIAEVAPITEAVHARGAIVCMDNSWSTPLLQKPLRAGVDLVVHTCTKYLAGHSDVVAGAVVGDADRIEELFYRAYLLLGGALAPHSAWLLLRSLRTLPLRLERQGADALAVARHLAGHPAVRRVHHPALVEPRRETPAQETGSGGLRGYSGVFSFELVDDRFEAVRTFLDGLRRFALGVSWGGAESLAYSPARTAGIRGDADLPSGLVRLSIGLEGAGPLIADLDAALPASERS